MQALGPRGSRLVLSLGDLVTGQRVMQFLQQYEEMQWWNTEQLLTFQNRRLCETVETAYREVPFYQDLYSQMGVNPRSIATIADLPRLPVVTKQLLRAAFPKRCTRESGSAASVWRTSGSSGEPFEVLVDRETMSEARALMFLRAMFSGWQPGQPILQTGVSTKRGLVKSVKDRWLGVRYVSAFDLRDHVLDRLVGDLERDRIAHVMGFPGSIYNLALRAEALRSTWRLSGVVTWGDNLYSHYRELIERQFGCAVTDTYGCAEGIQIGAQCGFSDGGYHLFSPHVALEVVDRNGAPVPVGQAGDILLTRLNPGAMPLIRYRVGDSGRLRGSSKCQCGRGFPMLAAIDGRDTDIIVTPSGNRLIVHFFTALFARYPSVTSFRVVQERIEEIQVFIVTGEGFTQEVTERIAREIHTRGDQQLRVIFNRVDTLPELVRGKRRFVISQLLQAGSGVSGRTVGRGVGV